MKEPAGEKSREMEGPRHRRRVINTVVPRCAALRSRLWIARLPWPRSGHQLDSLIKTVRSSRHGGALTRLLCTKSHRSTLSSSTGRRRDGSSRFLFEGRTACLAFDKTRDITPRVTYGMRMSDFRKTRSRSMPDE